MIGADAALRRALVFQKRMVVGWSSRSPVPTIVPSRRYGVICAVSAVGPVGPVGPAGPVVVMVVVAAVAAVAVVSL